MPKGVGSRTRQRFARAVRRCKDINAALWSLNWLSGKRGPPADFVTEEQRPVGARVARMADCYLDEDIAIPGEKAAFKQLLRGRSIYPGGDDAPGGINIARYTRPADVSLPESVHDAPLLEDLLKGTPAAHYLDGVGAGRMLRAEDEISSCMRDLIPHWDPTLKKDRRKRMRFYKHLIKIGMVIIAPAGSALQQLGIFFVKKAGETQIRLIIDARRCNGIFASPPGVDLVTSEALSRIEIILPEGIDPESAEGQELLSSLEVSLGTADIRDAPTYLGFLPDWRGVSGL